MAYPITKSKFLLGKQCEKSLYLKHHRPKLASPITPAMQLRFDEGNEVGALAREEFPEGILITAAHWEVEQILQETREAIKTGASAMFEAGFVHSDVFTRVDILKKGNSEEWDLYEVKSSTRVKEVHVDDLAVQLWVLEGAGFRVGRCFLTHLDTGCTYPDLGNLFVHEDVTQDVKEALKNVGAEVARFKQVLNKKELPNIDIGPHCADPYECNFKEWCWGQKKLPTPSVLDLYRGGEKKWQLYREGRYNLSELDLKGLTAVQERMVTVASSGQRYVNAEGIREALDQWEWPLCFLDFETIGPAIPRFDGTRSYEAVPFQFSLHVLDKDGELSHQEYLHPEPSDPRESLSDALIQKMPGEGTILAFYSNFEERCLKLLMNSDQHGASHLENMLNRIEDLLPVVRENVYDEAFKGSFSIKSVAPTLLGGRVNYSELEVQDGMEASVAFLKMVDNGTSLREKEQIGKNLLEYCRLDTLAMVELYRWLDEQE